MGQWRNKKKNKKTKTKKNNYLSKVFCFKLFKTLNQKKKKKRILPFKHKVAKQLAIHSSPEDHKGPHLVMMMVKQLPLPIHPCLAVHVKCSWNNIFWKLEWFVFDDMAPWGVSHGFYKQVCLLGLTCPLLLPQLCVSTFFFFMTTPIIGFRDHAKSILSHLETLKTNYICKDSISK